MADDGALISKSTRGRSTCGVYIHKTSGKVFPCFTILVAWILLLLVQPKSSIAYYVGPEVGHAHGETRVTKATRGFGFGSPNNVTSLAEAAYVPYVYSVGNNVVTFLRSIIPSLQPKVDFFAEQIQDSIDIANGKLMQTLENSNNGILAAENFFTGLMKAVVFGKGPDDDERRRRLAMALIRSGMLTSTSTTTSTTTKKPATMTTATTTTTGIPVKRATSTLIVPTTTTAVTTTGTTTPKASLENIPSGVPMVSQKTRDNDFNKMRVINIVKNMITET